MYSCVPKSRVYSDYLVIRYANHRKFIVPGFRPPLCLGPARCCSWNGSSSPGCVELLMLFTTDNWFDWFQESGGWGENVYFPSFPDLLPSALLVSKKNIPERLGMNQTPTGNQSILPSWIMTPFFRLMKDTWDRRLRQNCCIVSSADLPNWAECRARKIVNELLFRK